MADNAPSNLPPATDGEFAGQALITFTAVFIPVQVVAVALRYYARWMLKAWGLDDLIILTSLFLQILIGALCISAVHHGGVGYHVPYLEATDPEKLVVWGKYLVALSVLYFAGVNIPKLAILALYRRLFPNRGTRITINILFGVLIALTISNVVADLAACRPFEANWLVTMPGAKCIDKEAFFIWGSIPNILTDVVMLVLPMPMVWKLHTSKRIKLGLTITFAVGSFGLVTSVIRFTTFFQNNSFVDGTFSAVELLTWTQVEAGVYLISACLPTYRPLLERIGKKVPLATLAKGTRPTKSSYSNQGNVFKLGHKNVSSSNIPLQERLSNAGAPGSGWSRLDDSQHTEAKDQRGITITTDIQVDGHDARDLERGDQMEYKQSLG